MEFYKVFFITMTMFFIAGMNNPNNYYFLFLFILNLLSFIIMLTLEEMESKRRNKRRREGRRRKGRLRRFRK